jgi:hypothetical protein
VTRRATPECELRVRPRRLASLCSSPLPDFHPTGRTVVIWRMPRQGKTSQGPVKGGLLKSKQE